MNDALTLAAVFYSSATPDEQRVLKAFIELETERRNEKFEHSLPATLVRLHAAGIDVEREKLTSLRGRLSESEIRHKGQRNDAEITDCDGA